MKNKTDVSKIRITDDSIIVEFRDGHIGEAMFSSYPRLAQACETERKNYTLSHFGIHWQKIDEDLSFEGFYQSPLNSRY